MLQVVRESFTVAQSLMLGFNLVMLVTGAFWFINGVLPRFLRWKRRHKTCEPNVVVGYATHSETEAWMCGDKVCRCGGTKRKGYLDGYQ